MQCRVALDTPIAVDSVNPASASLTFMYKMNLDAGPGTKALNFVLQQGDWGYSSPKLTGNATLTADNAWHSATIQFTAWANVPAAGTNLDRMTINQTNWASDLYTANFDQFVFTSPVPEPTGLAAVAAGTLVALRRRRHV